MRAVARLAELNEVDLAVDVAKARLAEIAEALKEPAALRSARSALARAEAELVKFQARQRECEAALQNAGDRLTRAEQHLYSGKVTAPKELESLQGELAQLRRQRSHCEDDVLEALIAVDAAAAEAKTGRETVTRLAAEHEAAQVALREEQARLTRRLAADQARQAIARAAAPAALLPTYDALRARRGGRAVAALEGDTCSACRVAVSPTLLEAARYGDELVYCENCGRLLWGE